MVKMPDDYKPYKAVTGLEAKIFWIIFGLNCIFYFFIFKLKRRLRK